MYRKGDRVSVRRTTLGICLDGPGTVVENENIGQVIVRLDDSKKATPAVTFPGQAGWRTDGWFCMLAEVAPLLDAREVSFFPCPADAPYRYILADLQAVANGQAWKLSYSRLEQLIEAGYVNPTGARLTELGRKQVGTT